MGISWVSASVLPFAIGGAGRVRVVLAGDPVEAVVALGGLTVPAGPDAIGFKKIELVRSGNDWRGNFYGWSQAAGVGGNVHLFAKTAAGWSPVRSIQAPLSWAYVENVFPWIRPWIVDRLQELADRMAPLGTGHRVKVSSVFPTDTNGFPIVTCQVDSMTPANEAIGRVLDPLAGGRGKRGTFYNISISVVSWTQIPEERDDLALWLGQAMEILVDLLPGIGCSEPSASIEESEDFQTLDVPAFLTTSRLNTSKWSSLAATPASDHGLLTV